MNKISTFLGVVAMYAGYSSSIFAHELRYVCEDYPPANYLHQGKLTGASVEIPKAVWEQSGVKPHYVQVVPWARGYKEVQTTPGTVLFSMSRTPERENLFRWVGPIFTARHVLFSLRKNNITLRKIEDAQKYSVGTIRGDVSETTLRKAGVNNLHPVDKLEQNIRKLLAGRVMLISQSENAVLRKITELNLAPELITISLVLSQRENYFAVNKDTSPQLITEFQNSLEAIAEKRKEILKRYLMRP